MFTGLISEVGEVAMLERRGAGARITISAPRASRKLRRGDSVAVSGVCLTAVELRPGKCFFADLAPETLRRSSLEKLRKGAKVNLELPMRAGEALGGHIVQGHVDGVGTLLSLQPAARDEHEKVGRQRGKAASGSGWWLKIKLPREIERYVVEKGSIAVEGISLTVAACSGGTVEIAIIPHTYGATNLHTLAPGAAVNLEADVLAKYAEKMRAGASKLSIQALKAQGF